MVACSSGACRLGRSRGIITQAGDTITEGMATPQRALSRRRGQSRKLKGTITEAET